MWSRTAPSLAERTTARDDGTYKLGCGTKKPVNKQTSVLVKATGDLFRILDFFTVVQP